MTSILPGTYESFDSAVRYVTFPSMLPYPCTMHEHFEVFYIKAGSLAITIDDVTVTLHPGDISLTVPFVFHRNDASAQAQVELLRISPLICPDIAQIFGKRKPKRPYLRRNEVPPLVRELMAAIGSMVKKHTRCHREESGIADAYALDRQDAGWIQPYLSVLLLELTKAMELVDADERNLNAMQKVLRYCTANFSQDITRHTVSKACNVSLGAISQTFNRLGTTFRDYINTLRINRAYQLLTTTQKPITEIIYECGYSNQGTFNRNFHAHFGRSPREIRWDK